MEYV
ncbi:hypothetical protein F383_39308 [Gossypium arboreum]